MGLSPLIYASTSKAITPWFNYIAQLQKQLLKSIT